MIDIKPPEEPLTDELKFIVFLEQIGIDYTSVDKELWIDAHYSGGKDGFIIKFYDDGSFKGFDYMGLKPENAQTKELHELNKTLKEILREMRKRKT